MPRELYLDCKACIIIIIIIIIITKRSAFQRPVLRTD
jgi:hypothetical protein